MKCAQLRRYAKKIIKLEKFITFSPAIISFLFYFFTRKQPYRKVAFLIFVLGVFAISFYEYLQPVGHPHADFGILNLGFELIFIGGPNTLIFLLLMAPFIFNRDEINNDEEGGIT